MRPIVREFNWKYLPPIVALCLLFAAFCLSPVNKSEEAFINQYLQANEDDREELAVRFANRASYERQLALLQEKKPKCHIEGHALGRAIARTSSVIDAIRQCGNSCRDGCLHGVEMHLFSYDEKVIPDESALQDIAFRGASFCGDKNVHAVVTASKCMHGLGHAILLASKYSLQNAVDACSALPDKTSKEVCAGGVFMEYLQQADTVPKIRQDAYYPCNLYSKFAWQCFHYKALAMLDLLGIEGTKKACLKLQSPMGEACVKGFGYTLANDDMLRRTKGLDALCGGFKEPYKEACIDGALAIKPQQVSNWSEAGCAGLAPEYKARCLDLFRWLEAYNPETATR